MKRMIPSGQELTIQSIWDWYEYHFVLSRLSKVGLRDKVIASSLEIDPRFFGMTLAELDEFFSELDYLAMFDMLAATEAAIRLDYWIRVDERRKDPLSMQLREIYKSVQMKARLEEDILETWRDCRPAMRQAIGDFRSALQFRHWIAHGRYWEPRFGQKYSPGDIFDVCDILLLAIDT